MESTEYENWKNTGSVWDYRRRNQKIKLLMCLGRTWLALEKRWLNSPACPRCKDTWYLFGRGTLPPPWPQSIVFHLINLCLWFFSMSSLCSLCDPLPYTQKGQWMGVEKESYFSYLHPQASSIYELLWNHILSPCTTSLTTTSNMIAQTTVLPQ